MKTARITTRLARWAAVFAAVGLVFTVAPPASANGTGSLTISGTATLPQFPCPLLPTPCQGTFEGLVSGELAGTHLNNAWTATFADVDMNATFLYQDGNCAQGTASGTAVISGGSDHVIGTYDKGGPLPRLITGITITADFDWSRTGVSALVFPLRNASVTVDVVDDGPLTVMDGIAGAGNAVFVPTIETGNEPDCTGLGDGNAPSITAEVEGAVAVVDPM